MAFPRRSGLADSVPVGESAAVFCLMDLLVTDGAFLVGVLIGNWSLRVVLTGFAADHWLVIWVIM